LLVVTTSVVTLQPEEHLPELPEVETIRRSLQDRLIGETLASGEMLWPRTLAAPGLADFTARLPGQVIHSLGRRGKHLLIHLDQDTLIIHLRMSGDLRLEPGTDPLGAPIPLQKHDRAVFNFFSRQRLVFIDPRKFGRVWLTNDPASLLGALGPEPLADNFTAGVLHQRLHAHQRQLKPLLLDQHFLAGMGNIYTDEALHLAKLHPLRSSRSLSHTESERLWQAIRQVLEEGIRRNGASIDWVYRGGSFQNNFQVYQRTGETCLSCGSPIERILVGQRGTHYCPVCQPLPDKVHPD
jgi:formamidopyrimidine-DNA glycosylase